MIERDRQRGRPVPWDIWELYSRWDEAYPTERAPIDPFSTYWYDYECHGETYRIWSLGPDGDNHTADDIILESAKGASPRPRFVPVRR
jgi:Type II secretion system (T2SS), protein G